MVTEKRSAARGGAALVRRETLITTACADDGLRRAAASSGWRCNHTHPDADGLRGESAVRRGGLIVALVFPDGWRGGFAGRAVSGVDPGAEPDDAGHQASLVDPHGIGAVRRQRPAQAAESARV